MLVRFDPFRDFDRLASEMLAGDGAVGTHEGHPMISGEPADRGT